MAESRDGAMTVLEHLSELRRRLLLVGGAFLAAVIFSFSKLDLIRGIIAGPVGDISFIYISPPEAFVAGLRLSLVVGAVLAFPITVYQGLAFLLPGLYRREKKLFLGVLAGACLLFISGCLFSYYVFVPFIWRFFLKLSSEQLQPYINISEYVSFICSLTATFGLVFQIPLLAWILTRMELITARVLQKHWKYALLVILAVSAVVTPPDIFSQLLMAIPLLVLYELAVIVAFVTGSRAAGGRLTKNLSSKKGMAL